MLELWRAGGPNTSASAAVARAVEAEGWDGQMFMDSQSLSADPWVQMGAWAIATERLKLATGVTNPFTRHLAVTAASAASVQSISGGRAVLGLGRGDSALAYLGRAPVRLAAFERALHVLQELLRGEEIAFQELAATGDAPSLDTISLAARPEGMALRWLPEGLPKVPLDVAATGPKVISMSAPVAERVTFSVGAIPDRIDWALELARAARARHGLTDEGISYGAQVIVVAIRKSYDMTKHASLTEQKRLVGVTLAPEFVRRFTIVGPPDHCIERLLDLAHRGLNRFFVVGPGFYPESWGDARSLFAREVMPALRAALTPTTPIS